MKYLLLFLHLFVPTGSAITFLVLVSCASVVQPPVIKIPVVDYDTVFAQRLMTRRQEIDEAQDRYKVNTAQQALGVYAQWVGAINRCSLTTNAGSDLSSPKRLATPISVEKSWRNAKQYIGRINAAFKQEGLPLITWDRDVFEVYMDLGAEIMADELARHETSLREKATICGIKEESLPTLGEPPLPFDWQPLLVFENYTRLRSKASAVFYLNCASKNKSFNFFPNGYRRIAENTYTTSLFFKSVIIDMMAYVPGNDHATLLLPEDLTRYQQAYDQERASVLASSPCHDFGVEYYKLLQETTIRLTL